MRSVDSASASIHPLTRIVLTSYPQTRFIKPVRPLKIKLQPRVTVCLGAKVARRASDQPCSVELQNDKRLAAHQLGDVNRRAIPTLTFNRRHRDVFRSNAQRDAGNALLMKGLELRSIQP